VIDAVDRPRVDDRAGPVAGQVEVAERARIRARGVDRLPDIEVGVGRRRDDDGQERGEQEA
jgi:hypothetical protein